MDTAPGVRPPTAADFPGCKPVRLPREELDDCEIRLEYWDTVSVYLHPARARLPRPVLTVGEHDFPDVVLEVDHTTDARRPAR